MNCTLKAVFDRSQGSSNIWVLSSQTDSLWPFSPAHKSPFVVRRKELNSHLKIYEKLFNRSFSSIATIQLFALAQIIVFLEHLALR